MYRGSNFAILYLSENILNSTIFCVRLILLLSKGINHFHCHAIQSLPIIEKYFQLPEVEVWKLPMRDGMYGYFEEIHLQLITHAMSKLSGLTPVLHRDYIRTGNLSNINSVSYPYFRGRGKTADFDTLRPHWIGTIFQFLQGSIWIGGLDLHPSCTRDFYNTNRCLCCQETKAKKYFEQCIFLYCIIYFILYNIIYWSVFRGNQFFGILGFEPFLISSRCDSMDTS